MIWRALLAKDLHRARRNPLPWLINLLVPFCTVAVFGLIFGGQNRDTDIGRIRFALVDEDGSRLVEMLRGALSRPDASRNLEPVFLARGPALAELEHDKLSAVVILPKGFTTKLLDGEPAQLELIKNPAQSIQPAVLEELLGILTAGLNAVARNLAPELPAIRSVVTGDPDYRQIAAVIIRVGDRIESMRRLQGLPLVTYEHESRAVAPSPRRADFNIFGYLLVGMAALFLPFLAGTGMSDLNREVQQRTFHRYATYQVSLTPFVAVKMLFVVVMLLIGATLILGGGALVFQIHWRHPLVDAVLVLAYAIFAAGLTATLVALIRDARGSEGLTTIIMMVLAMAGGCLIPTGSLPPMVREHVMPYLPPAWFSEALRTLEFSAGEMPWRRAALQLVLLGVALMAGAAVLFRKRFARGIAT
jgi:ABC-2 type transport system permease protein